MFKQMFLTLSLTSVLVSCAHQSPEKIVEQKLTREKVSHIDEVISELSMTVDGNAQLTLEQKGSLKQEVQYHLNEHKKLKTNEAKVISLLLKKSLESKSATISELRRKDVLKRNLKNIYKNKAQNVFELVEKIKNITGMSTNNDEFNRKIESILGDI